MANYVPVIDLSGADRLSTAKKLVEAMETVGFVYLDNVPGYNAETEKAVYEAAEWFFNLPLEQKMKLSSKRWNKDAHGVYRGYVPMDPSQQHFREQYEMGGTLPDDDPDTKSGNPLYEVTAYPESDTIQFRRTMTSYYDAMVNAGMEFLRLSAIGMGLNEDHFDSKFLPKSVSSLRIMHYPPATVEKSDGPILICKEHFDTAFVTLLATFSYPGLEILLNDGTWAPVPPRPGSLVVNIGELLSKITGGKLKATYHRVCDIGKDRFSVPFFFEPRFDGKFEIPPNDIIIYGPWVIQRMRRHHEYSHVPDFPYP